MTTDLVPLEATLEGGAPVTLYGTTDPASIVAAATRQAEVLADVIAARGLYASMGSAGTHPCVEGHPRCAKEAPAKGKAGACTERRHVLYEGWALCGTLLGVFAVVVHTEPMRDGEGRWQPAIVEESWETDPQTKRRRKVTTVTQEGRGGWKATAHAVTRDGAVVGGDTAVCTWDEPRWRNRTSAEVLGMAQTRAKSRALRGPLGFIVSLAGYVATPAEEMVEAVPAMLVQAGEQLVDFGPYLARAADDADGQVLGALKRWAVDLCGGSRDKAAEAYRAAVADVLGDSSPAEWEGPELLAQMAGQLQTLVSSP